MISGRSFADISKWIYDVRYADKTFSAMKSMNDDVVFINGDMIDSFLEKKTSSPFSRTKKFIIIVHNSDLPFDSNRLYQVLPHAVHIFAINTTIRHQQLTTIPLGFSDRSLPFLKPRNFEKTIEVYLNVTLGSPNEHRHKIRMQCIEAVKNDPRVVVVSNRSQEDYLDDISRSKFVLCPQGTGIDTHRIYEALLYGATPVVLDSTLNHLYQTLPICIVRSWTDVYYKPVSSARFEVRDFLR